MATNPDFTCHVRVLGWRRGSFWLALTYSHQPNVHHLTRATRS